MEQDEIVYNKCNLCSKKENDHNCLICDLKNMTHDEYIDHTFTKEHIRKDSEAYYKSLYCSKCSLQCDNKKEFVRHCETLRHNRDPNEVKDLTQFFCEKCNIQCRCKSEFERHCESKKHLEGKSIKKEYFCEKCNIKCLCNKSWENHLKTTKHNSTGKQEKHECKKCEYICTAEYLWNQHCKTKKHNTTVE